MEDEEMENIDAFIENRETVADDRTLIDLSHELLCHILQYLPLHEVLGMSLLCRKLCTAVNMYLRLCKTIDFCEGKIYGCMPSSITDDHMHALFRKCPHLEYVYGLHPQKVERRRLRRRSALTVPGIIEAMSLCGNLKAVEISDLRLLEAIMQHLPQLEILGNFQNRDGVFPPHASHRLKLQPYPRISSLSLVGVEVPELTAMPHLKHLHLQCVRFTKLQPFRGFLAQHLKSFIMKHCMGPSMSLRYLSLIIALSSAPSLTRLELVRVPLPGGLFQRAIEDSYRHNGFVNLKHLVISGCKGVLESDLGHLMIVSSKNLESISIQPSLTRDSLFVSLSFAQCEFPKLRNLHLGFLDKLSISGDWSNDTLLTLGLAEVPDTPSSLTDSGMKIVIELFPKLRSLAISNCPHLMSMDQWYNSLGEPALQELNDLTLQRCHCIQLASFALFLAFLPKVEVVILNDMFREPPKGCSHVGLSAGTGLGMSSAVVSNQDEHVAVHGNQHDFDAQGEDQADDNVIDRDFADMEIPRNQEPHLMVLPQEFFDDRNEAAGAPIERVEQEQNMDSDDADVLESHQNELNQNGRIQDSDLENKDNIDDQNPTNISESSNNKLQATSSSVKESSSKCLRRSKRFEGKSISNEGSSSEDSESSACKRAKFKLPKSRKKSIVQNKSKSEKSCKREHKCSNAFDPSQPSTSKSGNCHCSYDDSDPEANNSSESNNQRVKSSFNNTVSSSAREIKRTLSSDSEDHDCPLANHPCVIAKKLKKESEMLTDADCDNETNHAVSSEANLSSNFSLRNNNSDEQSKEKVHDSNSKKDKPNKPLCTKGRKYKKVPSFSKARASLVKQSRAEDVQYSTNRVSSDHELDDSKEKHSSESENSDNDCSKSAAQCSKKIKCSSPKSKRTETKKLSSLRKYQKKTKTVKSSKATKSLKQPARKSFRESYNIVNQGTQVTSADIRRAHRKQKSSTSPKRRIRRCPHSSSSPSNEISARELHKRPKPKSNFSSRNKATSTSDPLMEDDAVQTLRLVSESLVSLSIITCGISDVVVDHCQTLTHIELQACRILKKLQLLHCPFLQRLNIGQCPKLEMDIVFPEILSLASHTNLLVSYEPCMKVYYPGVSEKLLFSKACIDQSVILVHDYTSETNETVQATFKENLLGWMGVVQKMHNSTLPRKFKLKRKKSKRREPKAKYPFGHQLRRIHGLYAYPSSSNCETEQWKYQILTNDRLLAAAIEVMSWERGIPPPCRTLECEAETQFLNSINNEHFNRKFLRRLITFYIPVMEENHLPFKKLP